MNIVRPFDIMSKSGTNLKTTQKKNDIPLIYKGDLKTCILPPQVYKYHT